MICFLFSLPVQVLLIDLFPVSLPVQVLLTLKKPREKSEFPFLVFQVAHLGINTEVKKYDTIATTFIDKITMKCLEFKGHRLSSL